MENPACWNETTKLLNKHLHLRSSYDDIVSVLVNNNLLLIEFDDKIKQAIEEVLIDFQYENDPHNDICGGISIGLKIYNALIKLNAIK